MKIRVKQTQDKRECMTVVSWGPDEGGPEIGKEVLYPALSKEGIPPKKFPMFSDVAMLFTPPEQARGCLQKMQDALKASGFSVDDIEWSSLSWKEVIMAAPD